uniref:EH domain-containing protein n=1 Tax=Glossina brevipalpis TaxID=37001 RepID=A0A1A9WBI1_9MUSC
MEEVSLTETETRYYGDLFLCCDEEKTGKIPMLKATELYRSANLPNDKILEIISLAGIPPTALHISRAQFYSCLKLIAASQASMPLRQELIAASVQLPLPRFSWTDNTNCSEMKIHHHHVIPPPPIADRRNSLQRRTEWPDSNLSSRRNSLHQHQTEVTSINSDIPSTDSEVERCESSCGGEEVVIGSSNCVTHRHGGGGGGSPEAWSTNSDSPTPTNSVAERPWAKETLWHGLLGDEHRQLLGTEEESSDRDEENETDLEAVYQITSEQREYYYKQFKAVQHDPNGLLSGQIARVFFEKSRIPVEELRHIWQLCDVTRDGALSLSEFTAAMHLVVLRRNNIPLPAVLPACLHPAGLQHVSLCSQMPAQEPPEADLLHLDDDDDEDKTDNTIIGSKIDSNKTTNSRVINEKNVMNLSTLSASSQTSINPRPVVTDVVNQKQSLTPLTNTATVKNRSISNSPKATDPTITPPISSNLTSTAVYAAAPNKDRSLWTIENQPNQWTKFTESPTSNVSSPGPKPVNFDMQRTAQAVVSDPQILHPVPLRVTPVGGNVQASSTGNASNAIPDKLDSDIGDNVVMRETSPIKQTNFNNSNNVTIVSNSGNNNNIPHQRDSSQSSDLRAIQRPQAKKLPIKNIGALPPPPQRESSIGNSANITGDHDPAAAASNTQVSISLINKKDPPPLPPPRPHRHGRSSSLDLNKFKIAAPCSQQPEITAQTSFDLQTSNGFADFAHFTDDSNVTNFCDGISEQYQQQQQMHSLPSQSIATGTSAAVMVLPLTRLSLQSNQRVSAFEVYRKPNTPRNSLSPTPTGTTILQIPAPAPFGSAGAAAMTNVLPNAELYEKRVNAISETLRHVSFKKENNSNSLTDILRHLREQNNLLLRLCNDLSDELLIVQTRKEEMRIKLEALGLMSTVNDAATALSIPMAAGQSVVRTGSSISAPVTANVTGGSGSSDQLRPESMTTQIYMDIFFVQGSYQVLYNRHFTDYICKKILVEEDE